MRVKTSRISFFGNLIIETRRLHIAYTLRARVKCRIAPDILKKLRSDLLDEPPATMAVTRQVPYPA